jgi:hypothetical protein
MSKKSNEVKLCRKRRKERLVKMFGGKCEYCGYDRYAGALEFHHIDPTKKEFTCSHTSNISWNELVEEAKKCVMMCANCHRELHAGLIVPTKRKRVIINDYRPHDIQIKPKVERQCKVCGKKFFVTKSSRQALCNRNCLPALIKMRERVDWSNIDLMALKENMSNIKIAKMLNVSEACIRKKLKRYYSRVTKLGAVQDC